VEGSPRGPLVEVDSHLVGDIVRMAAGADMGIEAVPSPDSLDLEDMP
jgi:hypothetical protein